MTSDVPEGTTPEPDAGAQPTLPRGWRAVGKGAENVRVEGDESGDKGSNEPDAAITDFVAETEDEGPVRASTASDDAPQPIATGALVAIGVFAGVYLLYTIGWFLGGARLEQFVNAAGLYGWQPITFMIVRWAAILAPALWFLFVFILTSTSKTWVRIVWLIAGAFLLIPWPFVVPWQNAVIGGVQ